MTDVPMMAAALTLAAGGIGTLGWIHHRDRRRASARRRSVFDDCRGLLDDAELKIDAQSYPELTGRFDEHSARLKLISDTVQLRKLPVLWLAVTLEERLPWTGTFDLMIRPSNTEFYSPHWNLAESIRTPDSWEPDAVIRSDDRAAMIRRMPGLAPHVAEFLEDGRGKELLITPRGVRLVWRVAESERGHYLAIRQPLYDQERLQRPDVERLLRLARGLVEHIRKDRS
ncbi:hypothetical protein ACFSUD_07895 [Sulfitobacter aestuarii]|uniref:DUF3137 domain-containing protein n=1 Tax=Sulfitobacter aestuarii TaxID=2161676 RepID=A0ABW5U1I4_9RHOB